MKSDLLRFGPFEADLRTGELRKNGIRIKLARQAFQVLAALAERSGELVMRDELRRILWPNETVVDFDHSINTAVKRIREALNDSSDEPRYLETLPRRGYRFVAQVQRISHVPVGEGDQKPSPAPISDRAPSPTCPAPFDWSNPIGQIVSHYRVLGVLGHGGMGIVYRGEDIRLGRPVALKFLALELESDPIALERFEQEARTASTLNHPNICTIYEVEVHAGRAFIAMELLEGATLGDRMMGSAKNASLSVRFLVDLAIQVGGALEAAHERGIIHRDIKPANIFLTRRGEVKVLDFGLATTYTGRQSAILDDGVAADHMSGTVGLTRSGAIPGTAFYMSPEQAAGEELDGRSDLYALGVVLYEAAAGARPPVQFSRVSPPASLKPGFPPKFWEIVGRLLEPDRELRFQAASDAVSDLKRLRRDLSDQTAAPAEREPIPKARMRWAVIATLAAAVLAISGTGAVWLRKSAALLLPFEIRPFTGLGGLEDDLSFAPNARQAAFVWNGGSGSDYHLYVKLIGAGAPLALTSAAGNDFSPAWSPDGRFLAVAHSNGSDHVDVFVVPALGGAAQRVAGIRPEIADQDSRVLTWSPDGKSLLVSDRLAGADSPAIVLLPVNGGAERRLTYPRPGDSGDSDPEVSPDGRTLAFIRWIRNSVSEIYVQPLAGGQPRQLTNDGKRVAGIAWTGDGRGIVFSSTRGALPGLWKIALSGGGTEPLAGASEDAVAPAVAREGNLLAYTHQTETVNIWRAAGPRASVRNGRPFNLISSPRQQVSGVYSPDGTRIAFASDRSGTFEIWVAASDGSRARQLTSFGGPITGTPHWSPDGKWIAFDSRPAGHSAAFVIGVDGGEPRQVTSGDFDEIVPSWSNDGASLYFCSTRSGSQEIWKIPLNGGPAKQVTKDGGFESAESDDGQWLYYPEFRN